MAFFQQKPKLSLRAASTERSLSNLAVKAAVFGRRGRSLRAIDATCAVDAMAGAGNRRGAGAERDRRRRGPLEAEAASDRERPAAAGPDPGCTSCTCVGGGGAKGQPRHRSGATVERDRLAECKVQTKARGMSVLRRGARWLPRDADHAWPEAPP